MTLLSKQLMHHVTFDIREPEVTASMAIRQALMVQTHRMQYRRMKVVDVDFVFRGVVPVVNLRGCGRGRPLSRRWVCGRTRCPTK